MRTCDEKRASENQHGSKTQPPTVFSASWRIDDIISVTPIIQMSNRSSWILNRACVDRFLKRVFFVPRMQCTAASAAHTCVLRTLCVTCVGEFIFCEENTMAAHKVPCLLFTSQRWRQSPKRNTGVSFTSPSRVNVWPTLKRIHVYPLNRCQYYNQYTIPIVLYALNICTSACNNTGDCRAPALVRLLRTQLTITDCFEKL